MADTGASSTSFNAFLLTKWEEVKLKLSASGLFIILVAAISWFYVLIESEMGILFAIALLRWYICVDQCSSLHGWTFLVLSQIVSEADRMNRLWVALIPQDGMSYLVWSLFFLYTFCCRVSLASRSSNRGPSSLCFLLKQLLGFSDSQGTDRISLLCPSCMYCTYYGQWRVQDLHTTNRPGCALIQQSILLKCRQHILDQPVKAMRMRDWIMDWMREAGSYWSCQDVVHDCDK